MITQNSYANNVVNIFPTFVFESSYTGIDPKKELEKIDKEIGQLKRQKKTHATAVSKAEFLKFQEDNK